MQHPVSDILRLSLWQFLIIKHGWELATGRVEQNPGMSAEEYRRMLEISRKLDW